MAVIEKVGGDMMMRQIQIGGLRVLYNVNYKVIHPKYMQPFHKEYDLAIMVLLVFKLLEVA